MNSFVFSKTSKTAFGVPLSSLNVARQVRRWVLFGLPPAVDDWVVWSDDVIVASVVRLLSTDQKVARLVDHEAERSDAKGGVEDGLFGFRQKSRSK